MSDGPTFDCEIHGVQPWNGEIICGNCDAAYTTKDPKSSMHAPPRCTNCGVRLMPVDKGKLSLKRGRYYSMEACCSVCFAEAPGGQPLQAKHDADSEYCLGEACKHHGPMIRKLRKRSQRASSQNVV